LKINTSPVLLSGKHGI